MFFVNVHCSTFCFGHCYIPHTITTTTHIKSLSIVLLQLQSNTYYLTPSVGMLFSIAPLTSDQRQRVLWRMSASPAQLKRLVMMMLMMFLGCGAAHLTGTGRSRCWTDPDLDSQRPAGAPSDTHLQMFGYFVWVLVSQKGSNNQPNNGFLFLIRCE